MTEQELQQLRREKWHLSANPVHTIEEARGFIVFLGFFLVLAFKIFVVFIAGLFAVQIQVLGA